MLSQDCDSFQIKPVSKSKSVENLRILYGQINDMKEDVNCIYSVHLLVTMASIFIDIVFMLFVHVVLIEYRRPDVQALPLIKYVEIFLGTTTKIIKLLVTVFVCHNTTEKGKKMGIVVHRLFENVMDMETRDEVRPIPKLVFAPKRSGIQLLTN